MTAEGFAVPAGSPGELRALAGQLAAGAARVGDLAASSRRTTGDVLTSARWQGSAADAYASFTGRVATTVSQGEAPLQRIAAAVREFADSLEQGQRRVRDAAARATAAARQDVRTVHAATQADADALAAQVQRTTQAARHPDQLRTALVRLRPGAARP